MNIVREISIDCWILVEDMISHPDETKSDSFYFVENQLIMHKKATYAFDRDRH